MQFRGATEVNAVEAAKLARKVAGRPHVPTLALQLPLGGRAS